MKISYQHSQEVQEMIEKITKRIAELEIYFKKECIKYPDLSHKIMHNFRKSKELKCLENSLNYLLITSNPRIIVEAENEEDVKILEDYIANKE